MCVCDFLHIVATHCDSEFLIIFHFFFSEKWLVWLISFTFKRTGFVGLSVLGTLIRQRRSPEILQVYFSSSFFYAFLRYLLKPSILYRVFKTRLKMFIIALQEKERQRKREIERKRETRYPKSTINIMLKSLNDKMCKTYRKPFFQKNLMSIAQLLDPVNEQSSQKQRENVYI